MRYLISYRSEYRGHVTYGYDMSDEIDNPIEWVASMQEFPETYILLNAEPISEEAASKYWGAFKGM